MAAVRKAVISSIERQDLDNEGSQGGHCCWGDEW